MERTQRGTKKSSRADSANGASPKRVLVVEDQPEILDLLADTLALEGYHVRTTEGAHGLLSLIRRTRPHLIILDLRLPGISGVELLPMLETDAAHVPLVIASGSLDLLDQHAEDFRRMGAVIVEKPFSLDEFLGAVHTAMEKGRAPTAPPPGS